jgi:hypothetical protein
VVVLGLRIATAQTETLPLDLVCSPSRYDHPSARSSFSQRQTISKGNLPTGERPAELGALLKESRLILGRQAWSFVSGFKGQR